MSDATDRDCPSPKRVGPYRIEARLGSGGMGEVYRAYDERLSRWVAIKHILPEKAGSVRAWERLRREARAVASLNHPAIVQIYDIVAEQDGEWIVMELVEGQALDRLIDKGHLTLASALQIAREIAEGLAEAHAHGIVHRDLKTENVMITVGNHAKILDFGLAKRVWKGNDDVSLSLRGAILGTGRAMSPEQAMGEPLDHRSDLFSLGSLLFEMFTGQPPFRGATFVHTVAKICSYRPPLLGELNPKVPEELSVLVAGLLAKSPARRPQSAAEVVATLASIARSAIPDGDASNLLAGVDLSALETPSRRPRRRRGSWADSRGDAGSTATGIFIKTLLCTRLSGQEQLVAKLGDLRAQEILSRHEELRGKLLSQFRTLEIPGKDCLLLLFERPVDGVRFALTYHQRLAALSRQVGVALQAPVGIHLGEVFLRENTREEITRGATPMEVEGLAKLIAVQTLDLARGNQTLLTRGAWEMARHALARGEKADRKLRWVTHGRYHFAGIEETIRLFEVGRTGIAALRPPPDTADAHRVRTRLLDPGLGRRRALVAGLTAFLALVLAAAVTSWAWLRRPSSPSSPGPRPVVAILGFKNLSARPESAGVARLLSEIFATELAKDGQLRLISGEDATRLREDLDLPDTETLAMDTLTRLRRYADVDYVILGSYLLLPAEGGDQVRVMVRMQATQDGTLVAPESPTGSTAELDHLGTEIARTLRRALGPGERSSVEEEVE